MRLASHAAVAAAVGTLLCAACGGGGGAPANTAPVAQAGADQAGVPTGTLVTLDGRASLDADGDDLTYAWTLTSRPPGSTAALSSATAARPTFTPDRPGAYAFELVVSDGRASSAADGVTVGAVATWKAATRVDDPALANAAMVELAFAASGDLFAVWQQNQGSTSRVLASRHAAATGAWSAPVILDTATNAEGAPFGARLPMVAADAGGNALAVWLQLQPVGAHVWASRYDAASGAWSNPAAIEGDASEVSDLRLAMGADGDATCVWRDFDNGVWGAAFDAAAGTWGSPTLLASGGIHPRAVVDSAGNATAVWAAGAPYDVWSARHSRLTGTWSTAVRLDTEDLGDAFFPVVAQDGLGNVTAAWMQYDGTRYDLWSSTFDATGGTWGTARKIEEVDQSISTFHLAMNGAGEAVVAWAENDPLIGRTRVWGARHDTATGTWGAPTRLETNDDGGNNWHDPQVAIDEQGNALVAWSWYLNGIASNRLDAASGEWTGQVLVGAGYNEYSPPRIGFDPSGRALALWTPGSIQAAWYW